MIHYKGEKRPMSTLQPLRSAAFPDSLTCRNLRGAYLSEMHAASHFLRCAKAMEEASLQVVAHALRFTAAQDTEHAAILSGLMISHGGSTPEAEAGDAPCSCSPIELLRAAALHKHGTWDVLYPQYARTAQEEGYPRIAQALRRLAETEQHHARRFTQYMEALHDGSLFFSPERCSWVCLHCGQLHTDCEPPKSCPGCEQGQGYFIRSNFYPFSLAECGM